ncbi:hypothetical protein [Extibacter sp. GGCC_0201]|uniref:hypothetical protein n=1 Tax=Extibacter sp. GGCC_0201 TaxID=2731209 RepID=UPI001AA18082|nr:hypothetical protein [Extibacter sp. GGCC_0201]MBO1720567.1 hypothetical protein [Extibacter sp. GGCC_0201]
MRRYRAGRSVSLSGVVQEQHNYRKTGSGISAGAMGTAESSGTERKEEATLCW